MKRILFTITLLLVTIFASFAQKETFFADKTSAPVSISNLQGITAEVEMKVYKNSISSAILFPVKISYFNEIKLGKTTSVLFSGGITGLRSMLDYTIRPYDPITQTGGDIFDLKYGLGLQLSVAAEPRWYFNYKDRVMNGRNTRLNSGLYFGMPVELTTTPLNSKVPLQLSLNLKPTIGYRYAITNKMFVEASTGVSFTILHLKNSFKPFCAGLKLGYAFK